MNLERKYFSNKGYRPFLFYVVFGVNENHLTVSKTKHKVDEVPNGLDIIILSKENNRGYIGSFYNETTDRYLKEHNKELYDKVIKCNECIVIKGEIEEETNLSYLTNLNGIIQALIESNAVAILDMQTLEWYEPEEWSNKFFNKEFNVFDYINFLCSEKDEKLWLRTRGMMKFGRPDISIYDIPKNLLDNAIKIEEQLVYYSALGTVYLKPVKVHTKLGKYLIKMNYVENFYNYDFNNSYYQIAWNDCETR